MKKALLPRLLTSTFGAIALALFMSSSLTAQLDDGGKRRLPSYSGIYAFGDSLTDTGNLFALTGQPGPPYFEGRASNGILWIEYLAQELELESSVVNFAVGGATTGSDNYNSPLLPGLQDQLDLFEFILAGNPADPDALYVVWAGANDFFIPGDPFETLFTAVDNTAIAVERLHQAGARHILVINLADMGLTPFGRTQNSAELSFISLLYNIQLDFTLWRLKFHGIRTMRFDVSTLFQKIVARPGKYGFTNVTDAFLLTGGDPGQFMFWDLVHPTTDAHAIIGEGALRVLRNRTRGRR